LCIIIIKPLLNSSLNLP